MLPALPALPSPLIPFGSPNPPVWTFCGGRLVVGVAELPVENVPVLTSGAFGAATEGCAVSRCGVLRTTDSGLERSTTSGGFTSAIFGGSGFFNSGGRTTTGFGGRGATVGFG